MDIHPAKKITSAGNFENDHTPQKTAAVTPTLTIDLSAPQATQNHPTASPQKTTTSTSASQTKTTPQAPQKPDATLIEKLARKSLSDLEHEEAKVRQKLAALKLARQKKSQRA